MRSWSACVLGVAMLVAGTALPAGSPFAGYVVQTLGVPQHAAAAQAAPWADRGWVDKGNMIFDNPKHGFHVVVPRNWQIDREDLPQFDSTYLWSMKKLDQAGNQRTAFAIKICPCQPKTAEQYFNDELAGFKPYAAQYQVTSSGPTSAPGVYEIQAIVNANKERVREVFFLRKGTPYVVVFVWEADATPAELAELDSVRRTMGMPAARARPAFRPMEGGANADHGQ